MGRMPEPQRLPDDIRSLSWHQAVHLHDDRFRSDVTRLVEMLESLGPRDKSGPQAPTAMLAWILTLGVILVGILGVLIGLFSGL